MNTGDQVNPRIDAWAAAIHRSSDDYEPLGCGVVIDERRILTCAHVIGGLAEAWVAFPKNEEDATAARRLVQRVLLPDARAPIKDLAILVLNEPVPVGVTAAPLRCPRSADLISKRWWAFGFPDRDPVGSSADGVVGSALAYGWVRLDTASRYPVERGFSGGGLWSPDYQAVVAIVSHANGTQGDGRAITLYQADQSFPGENLREIAERYSTADAGEVALSAWGWSLSGDSESTRHWRPRARGVSIDSERGYRFRGRSTALQSVKNWLDRVEPDRRVLVVTGAPGAGKSAVLGRIVTTADADAVQQLPASDAATRATVGSVACAVHAKGATALEIATKIAKAASAALPERIEDFPPALRDALVERSGSRFNVIIDALDEAASPAEARAVITKVIAPMVETCTDVGAQVVVGARRSDPDGDLLATFGGAAYVIDLGNPVFFAEEDLAAYARATLQLAGDERPGSPYADDVIAGPLAERIAQLSDGNFLVAGLTARTHGLYDVVPVSPASLTFTPRVEDAMREYLKRIPEVANVSAEMLLTALAFAEAPGLPVGMWRVALRALGLGDVPEMALTRFARTSAASFLVESSGEEGQALGFRLFHQALNDALLHARAQLAVPTEDEQTLTRAFVAFGNTLGWNRAPAYLLRSLPGHAVRAGLLDELLADDDYLLYADLIRVLPLADHASSSAGQQRARLLRLAPRSVINADAPSRAAMLSVTETLEDLGNAYQRRRGQEPYLAAWASTVPSAAQSVLEGHADAVTAVCTFPLRGGTLLATGSYDGTVRTWDPTTGTQLEVLEGHTGPIWSVCAFQINGSPLLATGGEDGSVRIWDPSIGSQRQLLDGHNDVVRSVCSLHLRDRLLIASASDDSTIRVWDPITGSLQNILRIHDPARSISSWGRQFQAADICAFACEGDVFLVSTGSDQILRIWNAATSIEREIYIGTFWGSVCTLEANGKVFLAVAGGDRSLTIWDPVDGVQVKRLHDSDEDEDHGFAGVCSFTYGRRTLLATVDTDGRVETWDPETRTQREIMEGHSAGINAVCSFNLNGHGRLATAADDGTVRIWIPEGPDLRAAHEGEQSRVNRVIEFTLDQRMVVATTNENETLAFRDLRTGAQISILKGKTGPVSCAYIFTINDKPFLSIAGWRGTIDIWDPHAETQCAVLQGGTYSVSSICAFSENGNNFLLAANSNGVVRAWDLQNGRIRSLLRAHSARINAMCICAVNGAPLLATASNDSTVRIWNLRNGRQKYVLWHDGWVLSVSPVAMDQRIFLASASYDGTIRLWDLESGMQHSILQGHTAGVNAVCSFNLNGSQFLASASNDKSVRIWNPISGAALTILTRDEALSVTYAAKLLVIGTVTGILAINLEADVLIRSLA